MYNTLQLSTIDLFTVNVRILASGRSRLHGSCKFYMASIYFRHSAAMYLASKRTLRVVNGNIQ